MKRHHVGNISIPTRGSFSGCQNTLSLFGGLKKIPEGILILIVTIYEAVHLWMFELFHQQTLMLLQCLCCNLVVAQGSNLVKTTLKYSVYFHIYFSISTAVCITVPGASSVFVALKWVTFDEQLSCVKFCSLQRHMTIKTKQKEQRKHLRMKL